LGQQKNMSMKKIFFILFASFLTFQAHSQEKYGAGSIPFVDGSVIFSSVEQIDSINADILYSTAKAAIADIFNSAKDVIQVDDKDNHLLIVKGMTKDDNASWEYTLKIQTKDGRYKIEMYDCEYTAVPVPIKGSLITVPTTNYRAEKLTDKNCLNKKGECKKIGYGYARRFLIDTKDNIFIQIKNKITAQNSSNNDW
jgi:hypothetical protein